MKRRWLIAIASLAMAITFVFGVTACKENPGPNNGTKSDEEIAQTAINTLDSLYLKDGAVKNYETPDNYTVLGQVNVDGTLYPVTWTPTAKTESVNIAECVTIGEKDSKGQVTIGITRKTVDVEYTLTASVTAGQATKTTQYDHKIPKKSSEDAVTASLSFEKTDARVSQTAQQQVWKNNGITFTNDKASSSNNIVDSKNPVRLYKGSKVTIEFPGITKIDFHSEKNYEASGNYSASPYRTNLKDSLTAAFPEAEITEDEETNLIVLKLANPTDKVEFTCSAGQVRLFSIDVEGKEGGLSDAEKLTAAKETLKLEQINYFMVDTVTLPTEHDGATLTWELKGTSENVSVENGTLKVTSLPAAETEVTLVAHLKLNEETADKELSIKLLPTPTLTGAGTEVKPYTAAEAKSIAQLVDADGFFSLAGEAKAVYIHGYVIDDGEWNGDFSNWTNVYIADSKTAAKDDANALIVYRLVADGTLLAEQETALKVGAEITVLGYLQNYKGNTPEVAAYGSNNVTATAYKYVDDRTADQKITDALAAVPATLTVSTTGETALPATTEPEVTFTWALKSGENLPAGTTFANNKLTVTKLPATDTTVKFVVTAKLTGATDQTKEISVTIKAEASEPEDTYFEITPSNFNGTLAGLTTSDLEENTAHPEEFTIKPNGYIKTNSFGHRIAKVVTEVYGSYDNMKMYAATSVDASKEVKSVVEKPEDLREIITYTFEGGTDDFYFVNPSTYSVQMYSIKIYYEGSGGGEDPQPTGSLELTSESFSVLDDTQSSGYAKYKGTHTVNGYQVTLSDVMPGSEADYKVVQFKKNTGTLTLTGTFTKITVVLVSTNEYGEDTILTITAGTTKLTPSLKKTEETGKKDGEFDVKIYTIEYTVTTTGAQEFTLKAGSKATYASSILFDDGTATTPEPEPDKNDGSQEKPYSVAEALEACRALAIDAYSATAVYVTGYVIDVGSWSDQYNDWSRVYIGDAAGDAKNAGLQIFALYPDDTYLKLPNDLAKGMKITVYGYLQNYKGNSSSATLEMTAHSKVNVQAVSYADTRTIAEKVTAALNAVALPSTVTENFALPKSTVTGVTLAFVSGNTAAITVGEQEFTVVLGATDVSVEITITASAQGTDAQTKKVTVIVRSATTKSVSLSFANINSRTSYSTTSQVWGQNDITFTNNKSGSNNNVYDGANPVRCYQNSSIKVEFTSAMKEIVFHCNSASYASALKNSITAAEGVTVTLSGSDVSVAFATPQKVFEIASLGAQVRINSIDVVYDAPAAATVNVAPVALLPGKEF